RRGRSTSEGGTWWRRVGKGFVVEHERRAGAGRRLLESRGDVMHHHFTVNGTESCRVPHVRRRMPPPLPCGSTAIVKRSIAAGAARTSSGTRTRSWAGL